MVGSEAIALGALLSGLVPDIQHNRLLRMNFPKNDGPAATLLPNRLAGHETISRGFRFEVELLSDDAEIPLAALIAKMVTISLVREDGSLRYFNGYVAEFHSLRSDGGFAFYQMVLEPWLAFAKLRKDNVSFHGMSVMEMTKQTFTRYPEADWQTPTIDEDPPLTCANQYDETDYNHLHRRWEALGLLYWYEHRVDGHTLMLSDKSWLALPIDANGINAPGEISFCAKSGAIEENGIYEWSAVQRIGSSTTTLASFDYKCPVVQRPRAVSIDQQGDDFAHEIYENLGAYGFRTYAEGEMLAQRRMIERNACTQYYEAKGNERNMQPGRTFRLAGNFNEAWAPANEDESSRGNADEDYLILSVEHEASNNYQAGSHAPSHYDNTFKCLRKCIPWMPGRNYNSIPCTYPGIQTAIVVGPAGSDIHTDGYGRVKVQFHWDRLGNYDENSSPWVRVMALGSGSQFGQIRLPRIGEEVAVLYLDGNVDHPVILGTLYNQDHMPPWQLPAQQALTGLRSREFGGNNGDSARSNHLVFDDTAGKIQAQLRSDHLHSQLSLGFITRIEDTTGRKDERGEGWELRSDGHGVARAAKGMLLTTDSRQGARGPVKDMNETARRLVDAANLHDMLAGLARQHGAQDSAQDQSGVTSAIKTQNTAVEGAADSDARFAELAAPHLVLSSPAGIAAATSGSMHLSSDEHVGITSGKHLAFATGASLFASIRQSLRLFVQKAGMKLVAAGGDIDIQALSNSIKLLAKLEISQSADRITITAREEIVINGAGSYAKFRADAIEFGTTGNFVAHACSHSLSGPNSMNTANFIAVASHVSSTETQEGIRQILEETSWVEFRLASLIGPLPGEHYVLTDAGGRTHKGTVDKDGHARLDGIPRGCCKIQFPDLDYSTEATTA
jgi:type VI secretion system secreted protein VgrG